LPYINIEKSEATSVVSLVELNSADSLQLITIKGIGPSFASRIIKYRKMIGGFGDKKQLLEIYGFTPEMLNKVEKYITIDNSKIKKININSATFKEINAHPYIDYQTTKSIIEVRDFNGRFNNTNELIKFKLITEEQFEKIKYYIIAD
jgi:DNA uptake protein ComE-like DNA-binding protein